jgi:PAS domain S-box-containing protein
MDEAKKPGFRIDAAELERRKAWLGLGAEDAARLGALAARAAGKRGAFLDRFYARIEELPESRAILARTTLPADRLRATHGDQLLALLSGRYDLEYAEGRQRLGLAHHRVGLPPELYIGAYAELMDTLLDSAFEEAGGDSQALLAAAKSLVKVLLLDVELGIGAYFHADHERLRLLSKVFESDQEAVLITAVDGTILEANHMVAEISGHAPQALVGQTLATLHAMRNARTFEDIWREATATGAWHGDVWHRHAAGHEYLARLAIAAVRDETGGATHFVIEYADATEAWEAERSLKARTEELGRSNRELEQFAYVASHDLQEPLRMVTSYSQLLARRYRDQLDADAREFIAFAVDGATRMQGLINDLLKFSRVGTRGKPLAPLALERPLADALANLAVAQRESGANVAHDPLPTVMGDAVQLTQLFQNLVGNAIKFRTPGCAPQIHVGARRCAEGWEVAIRDNGIGIGPEYFERIFVIFQRLHGKEEYPGTGIGLALCKKIVERHGGRIWVESRAGEGSTFRFTLPAAKNEGGTTT